MRNTGIPAEQEFDDWMKARGKHVFNYVFEDQRALTGRNKKVIKSSAKPSDRLVIDNGETYFAEIKSTMDPMAFRFTLLRATQIGFARQITIAGGKYFVFVKSLHHDRWFKIDWCDIEAQLDRDIRSLRWEQLEGKYRWAA